MTARYLQNLFALLYQKINEEFFEILEILETTLTLRSFLGSGKQRKHLRKADMLQIEPK